MPGWRVHVYLDKMFFGKSYWRIHRKMDAPVIVLGRKHRILFHDALSAHVVAQSSYPNDANAVAAANLHILVDQLCTSDPGLKRILEYMERLGRRKRKKTGKLAPKMDDALAKVFNDLKRIEEVRRLFRYFRSR